MVAGVDFEIRQAPRRAGDPASIVANSDQLMKMGWNPELNDLPKMIEHAHNWEKKLTAVRPELASTLGKATDLPIFAAKAL